MDNLGFVLSLISLVLQAAQGQVAYSGIGGQVPFQFNQFPGFETLSTQLPNQPSSFVQPQSTAYAAPELNSNSVSQLALPNSRTIDRNPTEQLLDPPTSQTVVRGGFSIGNGSYILEWEVNNPYIIFRAKRRGPGFVGFAISPSGGMSGADIFLAGINPSGMPFASDYHHEYQAGGIGSAVPDVSNDYQVLDLTETDGFTSVKFRRLLNTGDAVQDHVIENRDQNILWSIGPPTRALEYHGPNNRGVVVINLLDPPMRFQLQRPLS